MTATAEQRTKMWVTAKGLRALGRPVPDDVGDDEVVILHCVDVTAPHREVELA